MKVLVVCTGNICRSPTGQIVLEKKAAEMPAIDDFYCESAGTHSYHIGAPPDQRSQNVASLQGYDMSQCRAQHLRIDDFFKYDIFLAMDADHYKIIQRLKPKENNSRVFFFMEFSRKDPRESVPDPYYGNAEGFKHVLQMIEEGADTFLREMYPSS